MATESHELVWLDEASRAIAKVETIGEAKDLADKAAAIKLIAAKQGWSISEKARISEIEVRATVRLGELLADTERAKGTRNQLKGRFSGGSPKELPEADHVPTLSEMGLTKKQAHVAQRAASVPSKDIERFIAESKKDNELPTVTGLVRLAKVSANRERNQSDASGPGAVEHLEQLIDSGAKFGTIYVDPPWKYGNQATRASTDNHYPTMTVDEICEMPVDRVAADNAHLHLWTTNAFLFEAKKVMEAWGFEYKSCFVWVKPQMGIGNYWRVSHEFMLLGIRGQCPFASHSLMSWASIERTRHSAKPEQIRKMIETASPGLDWNCLDAPRFRAGRSSGTRLRKQCFQKPVPRERFRYMQKH